MILTLVGLAVLVGWTGCGLYFLAKRKAYDEYQRGFREGMVYGLKHKGKIAAKRELNETKSDSVRS